MRLSNTRKGLDLISSGLSGLARSATADNKIPPRHQLWLLVCVTMAWRREGGSEKLLFDSVAKILTLPGLGLA